MPSWATGGRILVAEADDDQRDVLVRLLQSRGYASRGVRSAEEVRAALTQEPADLLIVHYSLADQPAPELLRELHAAGLLGRMQAIVITGRPEADAAGFPVVRKPIDPDVLIEYVAQALGRPEGPGPESRGAGAAAGPAKASGAKVELALYVSPPWPSSVRALQNIQRLLDPLPSGMVELAVFDLAKEPDRAERDRILFSPTLVKLAPEPRVWLLGDLSDPRPVIDLLSAAGVTVAGSSA